MSTPPQAAWTTAPLQSLAASGLDRGSIRGHIT
jgi:hypothetical protein